MKIFGFVCISMILMTSCTHSIVRTGYQKNKSAQNDCEVIITKYMQLTDSIRKIGEIKLGETGFSVACSEEQAVQILKKEACALQADIINIVEENRPDFLSSCYRCRAEFYKAENSSIQIQSSELYKPDDIQARVSQDRSRNVVYAIFAIALGAVAGFLFAQ